MTEEDRLYLDNSICIGFSLENREDELTRLITGLCEKMHVDFVQLKKGKRLCRDKNGYEGFWTEEHMAMICYALYSYLPIVYKIDWLSKFLTRSKIQIRNLISIHYREEYGKGRDEYYIEAYWEYSWEIAKFFSKYYKVDYSYIYRDHPKQK